MHIRLSGAAREAADREDYSTAKVLWVLAEACSMMLKPESLTEPFKPMFIMEGRRSALPEDFDDEALGFFAEILDEIDDCWLRARIADLLWIRQKPRDVEHARIAIDAYRSTVVDHYTWVRDGRECWGRAICLCRRLGRGSESRLDEIRTSLVSAFEGTSCAAGYLPLWIGQMMREQGLCREAAIPEKLQALAVAFDEGGEIHRARDFFDEASQWYRLCGEEQREVEMAVSVAESYVSESRARVSGEQPSYMVAASLLESAIQAYRRVPRTLRGEHRIDERIAEIHTRMNEYGEKSLGEMGTIKSGPIDLTDMVEKARCDVRGKPPTEALLALSSVAAGANFEHDREFARRMIQEHPLLALFSATHMSADGRVVAKTPGSGLGNPESDEFQGAVWLQMIRHYTMGLGITVQGAIWPALEVLSVEHRFRELDLVSLARRSPVVPNGREQLIGKALFFGFERDFAAATHLLVPQIEHLVRTHIKETGRKTTTLNQEGVEQEKGLSALMDDPAVARIFGQDIVFEIKALFCDPLGPNLRNEIAHGLIDDRLGQSIYACYAWWFGLRLVFLTFWNAARQQAEDAGPEPVPEPPTGDNETDRP